MYIFVVTSFVKGAFVTIRVEHNNKSHFKDRTFICMFSEVKMFID